SGDGDDPIRPGSPRFTHRDQRSPERCSQGREDRSGDQPEQRSLSAVPSPRALLDLLPTEAVDIRQECEPGIAMWSPARAGPSVIDAAEIDGKRCRNN